MKKILILLVLICLALPAFAANWAKFFEKVYVDLDSLSVDKYGNITFWVKNLRKDPKEKYKNKDFWYSKDYFVLNCSERKMSLNASIIYDLKGNLIDSLNWNYNDWQAIVPDSYGEAYYEVFCKRNFDILEQ